MPAWSFTPNSVGGLDPEAKAVLDLVEVHGSVSGQVRRDEEVDEVDRGAIEEEP